MKETQIQKVILQYLNLKGFAYRINTMGVFDKSRNTYRTTNGSKGIPDIYFMSKKHGAIWFEVKSPKGRLNPDQKVFQSLCKNFTIPHYVVRSLDEVMEIVK